jgi:HlyD family secretion protein
MSRKIQAAVAVTAAMLAGSAFAQAGALGIDAKANANITLPSIDTNSDGKVSKAEAASNEKLAQKFDTFDANKDGNLDKGEFSKFEAEGKAEGKAKAKGGKSEPAPADGAAPAPAPKE